MVSNLSQLDSYDTTNSLFSCSSLRLLQSHLTPYLTPTSHPTLQSSHLSLSLPCVIQHFARFTFNGVEPNILLTFLYNRIECQEAERRKQVKSTSGVAAESNQVCLNILYQILEIIINPPILLRGVPKGWLPHPRFLPQMANNIAYNTSLERSLNILSL